MKIYCYNDGRHRHIKNSAGEDYTPAYIPIMLKNTGFCTDIIAPDGLDDTEAGDVIFIGAETIEKSVCDKLLSAKNRGARIVAFAATGDIFPKVTKIKSGRRYDVIGHFQFSNEAAPLPVLECVYEVNEGKPLGFFEGNTALVDYDGIIYWGFDLPATLLYSADGKPTYDKNNAVGFARIPDGTVITKKEDYMSAFADLYLEKITQYLHALGFANVFVLPDNGGAPADVALYFAGDDDATSTEYDLAAAAQMKKRGLPYHINMMPMDKNGNFRLTRAQSDALYEDGCELALHYDFTVFEYTLEGHLLQSDMFFKAFGKKSICPVNHCFIQEGSAADRYRFESECGCLGDNNRAHFCPDPANINAFSLVGFGSGTAFPRFVTDDAAHGNAALEFCELGVSFYEPRLYQNDKENAKKIEEYVDGGIKNNRTLQLFLHPHYICGVKHDNTAALKALDYALEVLKGKNANVWFCTPDTLTKWWHERAKVRIYDTTEDGFTVDNPTERTVYIKYGGGLIKAEAGVHRITKKFN